MLPKSMMLTGNSSLLDFFIQLLFHQSREMANTIFEVKIKLFFPKLPSSISFILNSFAFYYTENNTVQRTKDYYLF